MTARSYGGALVTLALGTSLLVSGAAEAGVRGVPAGTAAVAAVDTRPNIILISTDDQRVGDMDALTRTTAFLGRNGTTFDRAYAPFPLCCPARASIMTGQHMHNHGVEGNGGGGIGGYPAFDNSSTLATWLSDAGYTTAFVGKFLNDYGKVVPLSVPPGWDDWHAAVNGGDYFDNHLFENGTKNDYTGIYQTDLYAGIATDVITRQADGVAPFFLWTSFFAPHSGTPEEPDDPVNGINSPAVAPRHHDAFAGTPLPEDPSYNEADVSDKPADVADNQPLSQRMEDSLTELNQQRLESLLAVDEGIAQMMAALEASGELDNTIIVFTNDNGYMLGEHRIATGKTVPYEPSSRVPLIVRGPGFPAGVHRTQPVALIDLAPTFVAAAHATAGLVMDGAPLGPPARNPAAGRNRTLVIEAGPEVLDGPFLYTGIRTSRYVYVEYATGERELYDMTRDPYQLTNLAYQPNSQTQLLLAQLADRLDELRDCSGAGCFG